MKNIENQINAIISFRDIELKDLEKHASELEDRILQGTENMKNSKLFTDEEIKQMSAYAYKLLSARADERRKLLVQDARSKFVF
jgi:molecular chaperone GrpE (heat shock protein)